MVKRKKRKIYQIQKKNSNVKTAMKAYKDGTICTYAIYGIRSLDATLIVSEVIKCRRPQTVYGWHIS